MTKGVIIAQYTSGIGYGYVNRTKQYRGHFIFPKTLEI